MKQPAFRILLFFVIILLSVSTTVIAQGTAKVRGILVGSDKKPLEYIHVFSDSGIGTFSNQDGYFELLIPEDKQADSIIFSAIGFQNFKLSVTDMQQAISDTITMSSSSTFLKELVVTPSDDYARRIMEKAIKRIPRNYPNKKYSMNVFYRESNIKGDRFSKMFESYVLISSKGFMRNVTDLKCKVLQLRKTENYLDLTKKEKDFSNYVNGLFRTLEKDRVRLKPRKTIYERFEYYSGFKLDRPIRFFSDEFLEWNDFKVVNMYMEEGDSIAEISSKPVRVSPVLGSKNSIFVNLKDYAIIQYSIDYIFRPFHEDERIPTLDKQVNCFHNLKVIYKKVGDRYFPHYQKVSSLGTNSNFLFDRLPSNNPNGGEVIYQNNEFFVTEILPYVSIKRNETINSTQDLYDLKIPNDRTFWKNFNFPASYLLSKKALQDLSEKGAESIFIQ